MRSVALDVRYLAKISKSGPIKRGEGLRHAILPAAVNFAPRAFIRSLRDRQLPLIPPGSSTGKDAAQATYNLTLNFARARQAVAF